MKPITRHLIRWAGVAVALASLILVAQRLTEAGAASGLKEFAAAKWPLLFALSALCGFANAMLGVAWWNLLRHCAIKRTRRWAVSTYGISQLAKYIPGNVIHIAARQIAGMTSGIGAVSLAKTHLWELGLLCVAGASVAALALPLAVPAVPTLLGVTVCAVLCLGSAALLGRSGGIALCRAFAWYVAFLVVSGSLFAWLVAAAGGFAVAEPRFPLVCGAFALAWLAGLVTPGAPAGIGVRELALLTLLGGTVAEPGLLAAAAYGRAMTITGDLVFFLLALGIRLGADGESA